MEHNVSYARLLGSCYLIICLPECSWCKYQAASNEKLIYYSVPNGGAEYCDERVCLSVCVSVCLSVRDHIFRTTRPIFTNFLCLLPVAMVWRSSGSVVICYVFPVLWMTSYLHIS